MAETKACNLTEAEIKELIFDHGRNLNAKYNFDGSDNINDRLERINYLNKRLKAFSEPTTEARPLEHNASAIADEAKLAAQGWGTASNG